MSIITNISLDHTEILGDNLEDIAGEKSGIIKCVTRGESVAYSGFIIIFHMPR